MKTAEKLISIIIILSLLLRVLSVPASSTLVILSFSSLACFYMFLSYPFFSGFSLNQSSIADIFKGVHKIRNVGLVLSGLVLASALSSVLFKIKLWPDANFKLITNVIGLWIIAVVSGYKYARTRLDLYKNVFIRVTIIGAIALLLYIVPNGTLRTWYKLPPTTEIK
ncbi:MAG: hypothetical protein ACLQQ4_17920 [Bacteroidia bacterium]